MTEEGVTQIAKKAGPSLEAPNHPRLDGVCPQFPGPVGITNPPKYSDKV